MDLDDGMARHSYDTIDQSFWANVQRGGMDECWPWTGSVNGSGYGQLTFKGKHCSVHRVAYEIQVGPIVHRDVCHTCDNRLCVNGAHLFNGTHSANMKDCVSKGRISQWVLDKIEAGRASAAKKERINAMRQARILAGCPTAQDLSSGRMRDGLRDSMGRRIKAGQALPDRQRGPNGCFV